MNTHLPSSIRHGLDVERAERVEGGLQEQPPGRDEWKYTWINIQSLLDGVVEESNLTLGGHVRVDTIDA